jgi:hypothetical protein
MARPRSLGEQEGEFEKDKASVTLPHHYPSELTPSEVTRRNTELHENVRGTENTDSSPSDDSALLNQGARRKLLYYALSKVPRCLRHNLCSQPYESKSLVRSTGSAV